MSGEDWRRVPGYDNYLVSSEGRVWSIKRKCVRGGLLKPKTNSGYLWVALTQNRVERTLAVHWLVMWAFVGPPPAGMEIRHLDGGRANANLKNLAYGTRSENAYDRVAHGNHFQAEKTHCPQGHEYTPENTYRRPGCSSRYCRACQTERRLARRRAA